MASVNLVILVGRLGADPEVRYTPSGKPVASFNLATEETWKGQDGAKHSKTEWHKVIAWGKLGEIAGEYLKKGSQVYIEGKLQTRSWEDKEGNKRYVTEILAQSFQFLDTPKAREGKQAPMDEPVQVPDEEISF